MTKFKTTPLQKHKHGLETDLKTMVKRRHLLGLGGVMFGAAAINLAGCGGSSSSDTSGTSSGGSGTGGGSGGGTAGDCVVASSETAGPYPADGSNSANGSVANVLQQSGVVRTDIRTSIGALNGTAEGVEMEITMNLVNVNDSCATLEGYAIYFWHATREGTYSIYEDATQNYLRGVGVTDVNGQVTFTSIFPGCYNGRFPHVHFEVYRNITEATLYANSVLTSQFALPEDACNEVYALGSYDPSASNFSRISIASDNVFSDNSTAQMNAQTPSLSGSNATSYIGELTIGVSV